MMCEDGMDDGAFDQTPLSVLYGMEGEPVPRHGLLAPARRAVLHSVGRRSGQPLRPLLRLLLLLLQTRGWRRHAATSPT